MENNVSTCSENNPFHSQREDGTFSNEMDCNADSVTPVYDDIRSTNDYERTGSLSQSLGGVRSQSYPRNSLRSLFHRGQIRQRPQRNIHPDVLAAHIYQTLDVASEELLDRLFEYLSTCPLEEEIKDGSYRQNSNHRKRRGLTLPAAAVGWISSSVFSDESIQNTPGAENNSSRLHPLNHRLSLLKFLLRRVTYLRVTATPWPQEKTRKSRLRVNGSLGFFGDDAAYDAESIASSSVSSAHTSVSSFEAGTNALATASQPSSLFSIIQSFQEQQRKQHSGELCFDTASISFLCKYYEWQTRPTIDLRLFPNLAALLLNGVAPECIKNMEVIRDVLTLVRVERSCIYNLPSFFFADNESDKEHGEENDNKTSPGFFLPPKKATAYGNLTHLKLANCAIGELSGLQHPLFARNHTKDGFFVEEKDSAWEKNLSSIPPPFLSRFPNLQSLSLAHNQIVRTTSALAGLALLPQLTRVDLSFNMLSSMEDAFTMLGNIKVLILSGNAIRKTKGLERLYSLEHLALDMNQIETFSDVIGLANLPDLARLDLRGNPLCGNDSIQYRVGVLNLFRESRSTFFPPDVTFRNLLQTLPLLDGDPATRKELMMLKDLTFVPLDQDGFTDTSFIGLENATGERNNRSFPERIALFHDQPENAQSDVAVSETKHAELTYAAPRRRVIRQCAVKRVVSIEDNAGETSTEYLIADSQGNGEFGSAGSATIPFVGFSIKDIIADLSIAPDIELLTNDYDSTEHSVDGPDTVEKRSFESMAERSEEMATSGDENESNSGVNDVLSLEQHSLEAGNWVEADAADVQGGSTEDEEENIITDKDNSVSKDEIGILEIVGKGSSCTPSVASRKEKLNELKAMEEDKTEVQIEDPNKELSVVAQQPDVASLLPTSLGGSQSVDFPDVWGDDNSIPRSLIITNSDVVYRKEDECNSVYDGPDRLSELLVSSNLELYFHSYVFFVPPQNKGIASFEVDTGKPPDIRPKIQLFHQDGLEPVGSALPETFVRVLNEGIISCGELAQSRIRPKTLPLRGFHGNLLFDDTGKQEQVAETRVFDLCFSNLAIYLIPNLAGKTSSKKQSDSKRRFPSPIPDGATFQDGYWPHAVARHQYASIVRVTIGFGFQHLVLVFKAEGKEFIDENDDAQEFTYVVVSGSKLRTIAMLKLLQEQVKEIQSPDLGKVGSETFSLENDDKLVLDALALAVSPAQIGVILHFQNVWQFWKHASRDDVRRLCVVTDTHIFLFDERFAGDGTKLSSQEELDNCGRASFGLVNQAELTRIGEVRAADADPCAITFVVNAPSRLQKAERWRLKCRDRDGAEHLVEDVRKAMEMTQ